MAREEGDGTTWDEVSGATVVPGITAGPGSITGGTCVSGVTSAAGTCTIIITSATPGATTVRAAYHAVVSETQANFTASADKHWVNYRVTVGPDGVNLVDQPHDFTVFLEEDTGSGFHALADEVVSLAWAGGDGSSLAGAVPAGPNADSCTTDGTGHCVATVTSTAATNGTLTATYHTVLDSGPASFPDSATKRWVDYLLTLSPDAVNLVFTVTLVGDAGVPPFPARSPRAGVGRRSMARGRGVG